jgi:drug/metabolite transporter (DMT)-like permease
MVTNLYSKVKLIFYLKPKKQFCRRMHTRNDLVNWGIFIALSFIWGSSFILMKTGMQTLDAFQVAALRIMSGGIVLMPAAFIRLRQLPVNRILLVLVSGLLGNFLPSFLFCIAETRIDSALTGILNALTPVCTIITGVLFFQSTVKWQKLTGVLISFTGMLLLFISKGKFETGYLSYASLILLATICYGTNVNMVNRYLKEVGSVNIAAFSLSMLAVPSFVILYFTGYFRLPLTESGYMVSSLASIFLGLAGTAVGSIIFYMLVKRAGVLFASMVTYGIPFVAIFWGVVFNEGVTLAQVGCLFIILTGVYLTNK